MTDEQRAIYEKIMSIVDGRNGRIFFYGGTRKTFTWRTFCSGLWLKNVLYFKLHLGGLQHSFSRGRMMHSRFGIPLKILDDSTCSKLIHDLTVTRLHKKTRLIIWGEAPNRQRFEVLDRSLRDVM